ncbi:AbiH family protein [Macellibacteroides fermentans]|uniref:AbiH family protein n=1 Tax=Macellibacteroides fermentans TaxID=879969 RepID=UPI003B954AE4
MNRIIIIGNGFDRAHNLRTGYKEFIDDYWSDLFNQITDVSGQLIVKSYCDTFVSFNIINPDALIYSRSPFAIIKPKSYNEFIDYINQSNDRYASKKYEFRFENKFFGHISEQCSLKNWLDIENEYYEMLKKILTDEASSKRNEKVKKLNDEWDAVKMLLEEHLTLVTKNNDMEKHQSIQEAFSSPVELDDIATCKQHEFLNSVFFKYDLDGDIYLYEDYKIKEHEYDGHNTEDQIRRCFIEKNIKDEYFKKEYCKPYTLLLNFNYTKTAENLYIKEDMNCKIINIHGELNNEENPIIFGYGDELDEDYQNIEKTQDNDFLENIKSIKYHQTCNYRDLLKFIESGIYQVFVMGHSCGNSDRTLLNTLFEHNNCASIKVFYRQMKDGTDDYSNLIRNISRNFNDKPKMRDIVVNRKNCLPLVPFNEKALLEEQNIHTVSKFIRIQ